MRRSHRLWSRQTNGLPADYEATPTSRRAALGSLALFGAAALSGCSGAFDQTVQPADTDAKVLRQDPIERAQNAPDYRLGPGDDIQLFVWRNPELSDTLPIRPDGKISTKLIEDMQAAGKTPTELARDVETALKAYVQDPIVTVIVTGVGRSNQQAVKVLGQATLPQQLSYFDGMTVLDVIVAVGGLTEIADGNRAVLVREVQGEKKSFRLRLDDLVRSGDIEADRPVLPGDTIIIPESWL